MLVILSCKVLEYFVTQQELTNTIPYRKRYIGACHDPHRNAHDVIVCNDPLSVHRAVNK